MTDNQLYSSHTYKENKFSARETYIKVKKKLVLYVKIVVYYNVGASFNLAKDS